jgi:ABC-type transport system involved in multi-copper enzyme maturation permease subunit
MFSVLVTKELKAIILSPRFAGTFLTGAVLILLSVYVGIQEYRVAVDHARTSQLLSDQGLQETTSWMAASTRAYRTPDPMMVFVSGLAFDVGRWTPINTRTGVRLRHSLYSDEPMYAVFRFVDFALIVVVVVSLFALLFTYDAVSGEREDGTLKLVFSHPLSRAKFLLAKATGAWLGIGAALSVPTALAVLLVVLFGVPFTAQDWLRLILLLALSALFCGCFVMIGLFISALTRRSSVSFLTGLMVWVVLTLIIPRIGVLSAGQLTSVPTVAEIQGQREAFAQDQWDMFTQASMDRWRENTDSLSEEELLARIQTEDSLRRQVEREISDYETRLYADLRRKSERRERLALSLARLSPVSAFQLGAMSLAGTDIDMKSRFENAMDSHRAQFVAYVEQQQADNPGAGGVRIEFDSETGMKISNPRDAGALDFSGAPQYVPPRLDLASVAGSLVIDFGVLSLSLLGCLIGAVAAFGRYDVR